MEFIDLPQFLSAKGVVRLPGSKSISNRVLLLAALADGVTEVRDLLLSDDTKIMLDALRMLGIEMTEFAKNGWRITGCSGIFPVKEADLFLGNAGTAFRPLTAVLAFSGGRYRLSGVDRMHERPIGDLVDALRDLGADIDYLDRENYPPLEIRPIPAYMMNSIQMPHTVRVRGNVSSQFLTGLLLILPLMGAKTVIEVTGELISKPYIDLTLAILERFGVNIIREGWRRFTIPAGGRYISPGTIYVEGDASSASYFLAAGVLGGGPVRVEGVGRDSIQGDIRFAEVLQAMGGEITYGPNWIEARGPADGKIHAVDLDCNHIPDAAMTLATTALFADGASTLRNIASWQVKETDRIAAMSAELRKVGAQVKTGDDYIHIEPPLSPAQICPASISVYDDHRVAMSLSLAAFGAPMRIKDPHCVAKTFPEFFRSLCEITRPVPIIAIDGPSASGKGTVAVRIADMLGFDYLDSGALYRLTAYAAQQASVGFEEENKLAAIAAQLNVYFKDNEIYLDGEPVGNVIRSESLSGGASRVAALPEVRAALLFRQRAFARAPGLVVDGRDIGTVVFPEAALKIFLTASVEVRAERRHKQLIEKGFPANMHAVLLELQGRDERDCNRATAPLKQSTGAYLLDTTSLSIEEVIGQVMAFWQEVSEK